MYVNIDPILATATILIGAVLMWVGLIGLHMGKDDTKSRAVALTLTGIILIPAGVRLLSITYA